MNIKKRDKVLIIKGKDRGKSGKVLSVRVKGSKILIEGLNLIKKTVRAKNQEEKGQVVTVPALFNVSNVKLVCASCGKPTRVGFRIIGFKKERYCKRCKATN